MKPYYILFISIILFSFSVDVWSQNTQEQITGTWVLNYEDSVSHMKADAKVRYRKMKLESKNRLEKAYKDRTLTFNIDGDFIQQSSNGRRITGTWSLNNGSIVLTNTQGKTQSLFIKELTALSMVLNLKARGTSKPIFSELYYIKN